MLCMLYLPHPPSSPFYAHICYDNMIYVSVLYVIVLIVSTVSLNCGACNKYTIKQYCTI